MKNWIYSTQLSLDLKKKFKSIYILFGNDFCSLQNVQLNILKKIKKLYNIEKLNIDLNIDSNWNEIFNFCQTIPLFSQKKILLLNFQKNCSIHLFEKKLTSLFSFINNNNLVLILLIYTSYLPIKNLTWIRNLHNTAILINCIIPERDQIETWIKQQSYSMKLIIENLACQLLCYYYEGNHILLKQILQHLSLIYPDGNLSFLRIKNIIYDSAFFNYNHWIESILTGKKQRAYRILKQLDHINFHWEILLYKIQREMLIMIQIKYKLIKGQSLSLLFKENKIYTHYHRLVLSKAIQKLSMNQLHIIISLLVQMELKCHKNFICLTRSNFEMLTEIFCNTSNTPLTQQFSTLNII